MSVTAAALEGLKSTGLCAVVVVATNAFINRCSRSDVAMKTGVFYASGTKLLAATIAALGKHPQRNQSTVRAGQLER